MSNGTQSSATLSMKLEVSVVPVSDVDRAKDFYASLGWRLDADFASGDHFRVIQFTPPGSDCSVIFGRNVTPAAPGKDLADAMRRAEHAHGRYEVKLGKRDEDWPQWYARYMAAEQAGTGLPS